MENKKSISSAILHCISASIFFVCAILLIVFTCINKSAINIIFITIFSISSFIYFLFSTIYHFTNIKTFFKKFDSILNYIMLSTSILPAFLCILQGAWGWALFGTTVGILLTSIIMTSIWTNIPKILSSILYFLIISCFLISLIPFILFNKIPFLILIGIILYFIAELLDLLKFRHIYSHILISIACLLEFIFYFIYIFN